MKTRARSAVLPSLGRAWLLALSIHPAHAAEPETVVLIHGMGRTRASMLVLAGRFRSAGYRTLNFPYDQRTESLARITDDLRAFVAKRVRTPRYDFVAHSLGNIIIRNGFSRGFRAGLGRIVMLAPPNHPAKMAKRLKDNPLYRWLDGDSGQKLSEEEFYRGLPVPTVDFAVIAGDKGQRLTFSEPNDGIVSVAGTRLEGMKAFRIVHHTHTFMMNAKDTFELCRRFIETGGFDDAPARNHP